MFWILSWNYRSETYLKLFILQWFYCWISLKIEHWFWLKFDCDWSIITIHNFKRDFRNFLWACAFKLKLVLWKLYLWKDWIKAIRDFNSLFNFKKFHKNRFRIFSNLIPSFIAVAILNFHCIANKIFNLLFCGFSMNDELILRTLKRLKSKFMRLKFTKNRSFLLNRFLRIVTTYKNHIRYIYFYAPELSQIAVEDFSQACHLSWGIIGDIKRINDFFTNENVPKIVWLKSVAVLIINLNILLRAYSFHCYNLGIWEFYLLLNKPRFLSNDFNF